jgi:ATP-binding protein involved in chromosome partitioning
MSYFIAADGTESDIFGRGGAGKMAQDINVPFLGELPMFQELRVNSDTGNPTANFEANPRLRESLEKIVATLAGQVSVRNLQGKGPELTIV